VAFAEVQSIIDARCAPCHSGTAAPLGIKFEMREQIEAWAGAIEQQAVLTRGMPPGNTSGMTEDERELLGAWIAQQR
jgi:uncharacterized membrane protein